MYFKDFVHRHRKLSQMQISLQMFFKDFADRFRMPYLKNEFF